MPLAEHDRVDTPISTGYAVSIHVPLAEHDLYYEQADKEFGVSIHVPLAEHDIICTELQMLSTVSIHAPLAEHDLRNSADITRVYQFQFTCPSRSTTCFRHLIDPGGGFNSRAPRGARLHCCTVGPGHSCFNSRAPRGARRETAGLPSAHLSFQFTCPSRSTTLALGSGAVCDDVSIHVPLAEHDRKILKSFSGRLVSIHVPLAEHDIRGIIYANQIQSFNSRAPRGARPGVNRSFPPTLKFQFTCPSRSTT